MSLPIWGPRTPLKMGGEGDNRGWDGITDSVDMSLSKLRELVMEEGGLACCSPWCHKESDMTKQLNWTERQHTVNVRNHLQKKTVRRLKDQKKKKAAIIYTHKRQLPSREEYQSGQPFSSPGTEPESPTLTGGFFSIWATREAKGIHKTDVKYDYQKVIIRGEN